jgi:hypothetical protein
MAGVGKWSGRGLCTGVEARVLRCVRGNTGYAMERRTEV